LGCNAFEAYRVIKLALVLFFTIYENVNHIFTIPKLKKKKKKNPFKWT